MKKFVSKVCMLLICILFSTNVFAVEYSNTEHEIKPQNNKYITTIEYNPIKKQNENICWIPLRSSLEAIGATVTWDGEKGKIYITYNNMDYVAVLDSENEMIGICKSKYEDYTAFNLSFHLNVWGGGGSYQMIEDSTYVDDCSLIRLFYYFGYYIALNQDNQVFEIIEVNEESNKIYQPLYEEFCFHQPVDNELEALTLDLWCCGKYSYQYDIFDIIDYSSERLENDDLSIEFTFKYNDSKVESELNNRELWAEVRNDGLKTRFNGMTVYHMLKNDDLYYSYYDCYIIKCSDHYIGYSVVPKKILTMNFD